MSRSAVFGVLLLFVAGLLPSAASKAWAQTSRPVPTKMRTRAPVPAPAGQLVLVVLQENSGRVELPPGLSEAEQQGIYAVVDRVTEKFEDVKSSLQSAGHYNRVILLTDGNCKRSNLLTTLVECSRNGDTIDLLVLGHGTVDYLALNGESLNGGERGNLRSLLADARAAGVSRLNLRMVYMCNCQGSSLNDDWLSIGAKVSVGSIRDDYMPEPMITIFIQEWVANKSAKDAAANAYRASKLPYIALYPPSVTPSFDTKTIDFPCTDGSGQWVQDPAPCRTCPPPPKRWVPKMCQRTEQVPNGKVTTTEHDKVLQSELVVSGAADACFASHRY